MVEILDLAMEEGKSGVGQLWANGVGRLNTGCNCVLCGSDDVDLHQFLSGKSCRITAKAKLQLP